MTPGSCLVPAGEKPAGTRFPRFCRFGFLLLWSILAPLAVGHSTALDPQTFAEPQGADAATSSDKPAQDLARDEAASGEVSTVAPLSPDVGLAVHVYSAAGEPISGVAAHVVPSEAPPGGLLRAVKDLPAHTVSGADGLLLFDQLVEDAPLHLVLVGENLVPEIVLGVVPAIDSPLTVTMHPTISLRGKVVDEAGESIARAEVRMTGYAGPYRPPLRTRSDAMGRFELRGLESGLVDLEVTASGYRPFRFTSFDLASRDPDGLRIVLSFGARLSGTVFDAEGFPLPEAEVTLLEPESGPVGESRQVRTDTEGDFELGGLSPGTRTLRATHPDHPPATLEVELDQETEVEVHFTEGFTVSGRVLDGLGLPVARVPVRARRLADPHRRTISTITDEEGGFVLRDVVPGRHLIRAEPADWAPATQTLELNPRHPDVELRLAPGATVTGMVRGLDNPAEGTQRVIASGSGPLRSAVVSQDGRYRIDRLPPGHWTLRLDVGGRFARESVQIETEAAEYGFEIFADLDLGGSHTLSGVIHRRGEPLAGASVSLVKDGFWARGYTAHDGSFRLAGLADGAYEIAVRDFASGLRHREDLVLDRDRYVPLDLAPTAVRATVREAATGLPLSGISIQLIRLTAAGEQLASRQHSDVRGRVDFGDIGGGVWQLNAHPSGFEPTSVRFEPRGQLTEDLELWLER